MNSNRKTKPLIDVNNHVYKKNSYKIINKTIKKLKENNKMPIPSWNYTYFQIISKF